jgi:anaerobic magnesium-protoporphyrin IX monomethyl ester cyclase
MHSVVLINPPLTLEDRYGKDMKRFGAVSEPLGLAYIAGYLESLKIPVRILDSQAEGMSIADVVTAISSGNEKLIGITMLTPAFGVVKALCRQIKMICPDRTIVLGGAHCTVLPERTLEEIPEADIICIGEGEVTFSEIAQLEDLSLLSGIKGIFFRANNTLTKTGERQPVQDLDQIPPPARHMLPMEKYHLTASRVSGSGYCPTILVARGCPFSCSFCSRTFGRTFRTHSIRRIVSEIQSLMDTYQISQLNIEADTLTVNKKFIKALCIGLIESGISSRIRWTCESRVDTVDEGLLELMHKAGCWQISYGVETGSQRLLDSIDKSISLKQIEQIFQITKRVGISIRGFFMLGLPGETPEESQATIDFAKKLNPLWAQFTVTVPYPGTKMFEDIDQQGKIRTYNWEKYNTWSGWQGSEDIPFVPDGRTVEELRSLQKRALREFYLRPVVVLQFLKHVQSWKDLHKYFVGVIVLLKSKFR